MPFSPVGRYNHTAVSHTRFLSFFFSFGGREGLPAKMQAIQMQAGEATPWGTIITYTAVLEFFFSLRSLVFL